MKAVNNDFYVQVDIYVVSSTPMYSHGVLRIRHRM